ncbi:arginase family protein [Pseudobdellovibrio exovorus]|uniref:Arginase n=1 Tax=Pseudobdellovibrio exovorus JSS TaxID=1184267 RepID=M4VAF3_9BACT|nr:arginase family protein [Pseudobdellovibrio exovorus]AGH96387.1 hypothetical protein A11Q_2171 [Pseudobdellovibrio exovorus JSS]
MLDHRFSYIEAPVYQGQKNFGTALGPAFLRQSLLDQGFQFNTYSVQVSQSQKHMPFSIYEELSWLTERELRRANPIFIAGGDHSLSIGSVQGLLRAEPDLKVIWVDAHGDVNTRASSMTGSYHGMPLAYLLGAENADHLPWFTERLKPQNLIYFGVRDLDQAEQEYLDQQGITYYTAEQIHKTPETIIQKVSCAVKGAKVHFSVDCDGFDPMIAPSTGVPVAQGLQYQVVRDLICQVQSQSQIVSYEYVELNPQIFQQAHDVMATAQIGIELFKEILNGYKTQGAIHGFNDRSISEKGTRLLHRSFQLEE